MGSSIPPIERSLSKFSRISVFFVFISDASFVLNAGFGSKPCGIPAKLKWILNASNSVSDWLTDKITFFRRSIEIDFE